MGLKAHIFETADACGLKDEARKQWTARLMAQIDTGQVASVIKKLRAHKGRGKKRVNRLLAYLIRFQGSVSYSVSFPFPQQALDLHVSQSCPPSQPVEFHDEAGSDDGSTHFANQRHRCCCRAASGQKVVDDPDPVAL